jgi:prepilin-type processing-associated H-X9-DG protein
MMPASWQGFAKLPSTFTDGMSNTLLFVEKQSVCNNGGSLWGATDPDLWQPNFGAWSMEPPQFQPRAADCNPARAQTPFSGGINVALADGSVRPVASQISGATWWAACTPNGDEVLGSDW